MGGGGCDGEGDAVGGAIYKNQHKSGLPRVANKLVRKLWDAKRKFFRST